MRPFRVGSGNPRNAPHDPPRGGPPARPHLASQFRNAKSRIEAHTHESIPLSPDVQADPWPRCRARGRAGLRPEHLRRRRRCGHRFRRPARHRRRSGHHPRRIRHDQPRHHRRQRSLQRPWPARRRPVPDHRDQVRRRYQDRRQRLPEPQPGQHGQRRADRRCHHHSRDRHRGRRGRRLGNLQRHQDGHRHFGEPRRHRECSVGRPQHPGHHAHGSARVADQQVRRRHLGRRPEHPLQRHPHRRREHQRSVRPGIQQPADRAPAGLDRCDRGSEDRSGQLRRHHLRWHRRGGQRRHQVRYQRVPRQRLRRLP